jgi:hypothetical protein
MDDAYGQRMVMYGTTGRRDDGTSASPDRVIIVAKVPIS